MKKKLVILLLLVYCYLFIAPSARADYVLPYPSYMPGNKLYRITRILDTLKKYWYFGNIAQMKYHLALSDKYLVEAKTLFEYKQYLVAVDALKRSDTEFQKLPKNELTDEAAKKHIEVLSQLLTLLPAEFTWTPEKSNATQLPLKDLLESSIRLRQLW